MPAMDHKPPTVRSSTYHARMQRVLAYIDEHLDDDLDIATLSQVAAFSKFHFQRQFAELFGISPAHYVRLVRLKRASQRMAFESGPPVIEVALESGYQGPEAFARAFKHWLGQSPTEFRRDPDWVHWQAAVEPIHKLRGDHMTRRYSDEQVSIVDFPETPVAVMEHRGDPAMIGVSVRRFVAWRKEVGLSPPRSATFNIFHDDPEQCAAEDFRLDLCAATDGEIAPNSHGVSAGLIPTGRCAVLRQTGSADDLRDAANFLYADWLPRSGEELRDFPFFAQRVAFYPQVPEHESITDLFLPLR